MGAGKSTVAQKLAVALNRKFYDTDHEIQARTGVDISWIFDVEGEEGFRERETAVLKQLVVLPNIILATGGGTILRPENRQLLSTHGHVIHLTTNLKRQVERTIYNKYKRPSLRGEDSHETIKCFSQERGPLYEEIADKTVVSNHRRVTKVVKEILQFIKQNGW